jgi:hypothetical protein
MAIRYYVAILERAGLTDRIAVRRPDVVRKRFQRNCLDSRPGIDPPDDTHDEGAAAGSRLAQWNAPCHEHDIAAADRADSGQRP